VTAPHHCAHRFCTEKYSLSSKNLKNRFGHLTNYSVNKKNEAFGKNTDAEVDGEGSKWSLQALLRWFRDNGIDDAAVRPALARLGGGMGWRCFPMLLLSSAVMLLSVLLLLLLLL
jgi:hypothetical protein